MAKKEVAKSKVKKGAPKAAKKSQSAGKSMAARKPKNSGKSQRAKDIAADPSRTSASLNDVRISARKARLVVNMIRNQQVEPAIRMLQFSPKKGCALILKLLQSAIMNGREAKGLDVDKLWVVGGWVGEGRPMKRTRPRARGSADVIKKNSAHITLVLGEK